MASQETPNYRLSRWAGTDRILVEEFNSDNEKIDTALKSNADAVAAAQAAATALEKRTGLKHIQTLSVSAAAAKVSWPISINWGEWAEVYVVVSLNISNFNSTYFLVVNDGSGSYAATSRATLISNVKGSCGATVYPMFNAAGTYLGFQWDGQRISDGLPYANSANLELEANTSGVNILPGTSVSFYGRK